MSNDIIFYSMPIAMLGTLIVGYAYDMFGRRITLCLNTIMTALFMLMVPFTAPSIYPMLIVVRMGLGFTFAAPNC